MKLVIQTQEPIDIAMDISEASDLLKQVHAVETAPPMVLNNMKFHYFQIDDDADLDGLISKLMEFPAIKAAYNKPADALPSM